MTNVSEEAVQFMNQIENNQFESVEQNQAEQQSQTEQNQEEIKIEEIPKSIFHKDNTARFSSSDWFKEVSRQVVSICGCGGIGSWVTALISRLNLREIYLYDPDKIESVNMAGQFYIKDLIGDSKVDGLSRLMMQFSHYYSIGSLKQEVSRYSTLTNIVICGFDNMRARKEAFIAWDGCIYKPHASDYLFIDGRLDAETFQVFCIRGDNDEAKRIYKEKYLFSDEEGESVICSYKQTSFCASMIASVITNLFVNYCSNKANGDFRSLPFLTTYDATTMQLKQE